MQKQHGLMYDKKRRVRSAQAGMLSSLFSGALGGGAEGMEGKGVDMLSGVMGLLPKPQGAATPGFSEADLRETNNAGSGFATAGNAVGVAGDLVSTIFPAAKPIAMGIEYLMGFGEQKKKREKALEIEGINSVETSNTASADAMAAYGASRDEAELAGDPLTEGMGLGMQNGGKLGIMDIMRPSFKAGGAAPKWSHSFDVNIPEGVKPKKEIKTKVFKRGGKFNDPNKTNVVVTGARHHEKNDIGDNGVPVVTPKGEKVFEIEKGELVLTEDVTAKVEAYLKKYKRVETQDEQAHKVLKELGAFFTEEIKGNLHNYETDAV